MRSTPRHTLYSFYSARNARIASAVLATAIPSVRLSVRLSVHLSVCHTPVLWAFQRAIDQGSTPPQLPQNGDQNA